MNQVTSLADPITFTRGPGWRNRLALAPLTNLQSHPDGTLSDDEYRWLVARADGGFGLTMTCAAYVERAGNAWPGQLGVSDDTHLPGLTRLAAGIREAGGVSSIQLHHGGLLPMLGGVSITAPTLPLSERARSSTTTSRRARWQTRRSSA